MNSSNNACCMYCKSPQDNLFLAANLNKSWVYSTYKNHMEQVLVDREISKIPETQDKALAVKQARQEREVVKSLVLQKKKLMEEVKKLDLQIIDKNLLIANLENTKPGKSHNNFNFKCPNVDCNGFLNNNYNCKLCESSICKECMEIMGEEHECDQEKIDTVKFIKKDTKPCPGCGELIHKIHGCDQMWCIRCKVAFSWKTGELENNNIHNPEYYRWMRENGTDIPRATHNNECDLIPDIQFIYNIGMQLWPKNMNRYSKECFNIISIHRFVSHITMINRAFTTNMNNNESKIEMLRIRYILKELDLNQWKSKLHAIDKFIKKETAMIQIWNLIRDVLSKHLWYVAEQFNEFLSQNLSTTEVKINIKENTLTKIDSIRLFCNKEFERIANLYNCDSFVILEDWTDISLNSYKRQLTSSESSIVGTGT
jgi:hypothetical protein